MPHYPYSKLDEFLNYCLKNIIVLNLKVNGDGWTRLCSKYCKEHQNHTVLQINELL